MRTHRFYTGSDLKLKKDFWLHDEALLWQWNKVLRFREGQEVLLFDGLQTDRLYKIIKLDKTEAHLQMITEIERSIPGRHIYLFWSLLKKDNNEVILQKATELGATNFVPIITERTIKKEFNIERANRIVKEASEQCGRSDIPHVREPVHILKALEEYQDKLPLYICQQGRAEASDLPDRLGVIIGPEGGWSNEELEFFANKKYEHISLSEFTLRAETAALIAVSKLL